MKWAIVAASLAAFSGCAHGARASSCTAYEAAVEPARSLCHRACDAIPASCPWAEPGEGFDAELSGD